MLMSFLEEGVFYCQGTFQNLANALVEALTKKKNGGRRGEILLQSRVRRIIVKENRVTGVILENGSKIKAPIVISNADATQTFEELVGVEKLPKSYVSKLSKMKPSLSAFVVYMATDMNLDEMGARHEMFLNKSWNHDEAYSDIYNGKPSGIGITIPTLTDPSLAPVGQHLVIATTLIPYDIVVSWRRQKAEYARLLMSDLEKVFPGLQKHITYAEGATPRTMERYTLNLTGAIYGWEASPQQVGKRRLGHRTPIHGLYLSGHWSRPGGGLYGVIVSGLETAGIVSGHVDMKEFLQTLTR
jgi:phytoene dehydrogenase-like protein